MERGRGSIGNWNGQFYQTRGLTDTVGWHHYAVVFTGGEVSMYWDGEALGTFAQAIALTTGLTTQIGSSDPDTPTEGWVGGIDEVAFYGTALSSNAVRSHFLAMVSQAPQPSINISRTGSQVTLSWPVDADGYTLESTDKLPATAWTPVSGVTSNTVTLTASAGSQFYRLRK